MKFLVDMPLSRTLALWLQSQGHDAVHAIDLAMERAPDTDLIERAVRDHRTIVTADLDYPRLLALRSATAPSLILFRGGDWSEADVIARLSQVFTGLNELEIEQSLLVIERDRVRRRRLPIV